MKPVLLQCVLIGAIIRASYCRILSPYERAIYKLAKTNGNEHGLNRMRTGHLIEKDDFECPSPDGVFSADDQCTGAYWLCVDGDSYSQQCPGNFIFDVATQTCVSPSESSCVPGKETTTTPTDRTTSSTTERTTTRSTEESTTQQESTTSTQQELTSSTGLSSITTTKAAITTPAIFTCPSPNGNFPIPDTCGSNYYVCIDDFPYVATCPNGGIFDPVLHACVPSNEASCYAPFVCPESDGFFPIPGACSNSYYVCIAGTHYIATCPDEGIFDPIPYACVPLSESSCNNPFVCPQDDGFFPIPGTCSSSYYVCVAGYPFIMNCPEDLLFDPLGNECLAQEDVSCNTDNNV